MADTFYVRYYTGHRGQFGHEFLEFEFNPDGRLRYANSTQYRREGTIRKEAVVSSLLLKELRRIITESGVMREDDRNWPEKNIFGKQELEIRMGDEHISFETAKLGSLADVMQSEDPEGLRVFYYLVQDLKFLVFSLISLHFKIKPIG